MSDDYLYIDENHRLRVEYDDSPMNPRKDWDQMTGFTTIKNPDPNHIDVEECHPDPTGRLTEAHERFDEIGYPKWDPNKGYQRRRTYFPEPEEITERWARIFYDLTVEWDAEHGGYWYVDPDEFAKNWEVDEAGTVAVLKQRKNEDGSYASGVEEVGRVPKAQREHEIIEAERRTYNQWAQGEVYGVIAEKRVSKQIITKDLETGEIDSVVDAEDWETEDSLWGIYMDDEYYGPTVEKMALAVAKDNFDDAFTKK